MNRVRRSAIALFFVISLIAPSLMPSGVAGATTNYDNSLQLATSLRTSSAVAPNQACDPTDLSFDWSTYLTDESKWRPGANHSAAKVSFLAAKANAVDGAWGVHQYSGTPAHGGQRDIVEFWWTEDPTARLDWSTDGVTISTATPGANIRLASIACTNYYYGGGSSVPVVTMTASIPSYGVSTATSSSPGYTAKLLFAHGFDPNYPIGYAGPQIPADQPAAKYVAMGDSFSSGEGNPSFDPATDQDGVNECHRSPKAFPRLLQSDPSLNIGPVAFVACGGATTANVIGGQWNEPPQVNALSDAAENVTLTIGGNDIGIRDLATACALSICNFSTPIYSTVVDKINNELPAKLEDVLDEIATRVGSSTKVYVIGYPHIAPPIMPTGHSSFCAPLNGQLDNPDPLQNDGATVRDVVSKLNDAIENAVDEVSDPRFSFVNPNDVESPFVGHDWCEQDRYFQIIALNGLEYSFHPNEAGHDAYKIIVKDALS